MFAYVLLTVPFFGQAQYFDDTDKVQFYQNAISKGTDAPRYAGYPILSPVTSFWKALLDHPVSLPPT